MLDLGLGGTTAPGLERFLARGVGGSATVRDVEAEGLADVYLGIHERRDELESALVLNAADGTHFGGDVINGRELGPQVISTNAPIIFGICKRLTIYFQQFMGFRYNFLKNSDSQ